MALDENALTLLLGQAVPQAQVARFQAARFTQFSLPELPAGLPSELLVRRADIRQAEQGLKAANANIAAARAAFFPRISLTATAGVASTELGTLLSSGTLAFSLAPQVLMPLFDAGRNRATWELARAAAEASMVQYEKSVQVAFREVADALATRAGWARQLQAQQAQTQADMERLRLVALRLEHGAASQLDVLELERTVLADQQALTAAQWAYLQSQVTLYKVLGGGPEE
jgi:multidrug efflux system outer membrane protein